MRTPLGMHLLLSATCQQAPRFPDRRRVELTFLYPFIACCGLHGIAVATVVAVMRGYRAQQVGAEQVRYAPLATCGAHPCAVRKGCAMHGGTWPGLLSNVPRPSALCSDRRTVHAHERHRNGLTMHAVQPHAGAHSACVGVLVPHQPSPLLNPRSTHPQMRAEVEAHSRRVQRALLQELQAMAGAAGGGAPQQVLPPIRTLSAELVLVLQPDYSVTSSMLPSRGVSRCGSVGSMTGRSSLERAGRSKGAEGKAGEEEGQERQKYGCGFDGGKEGGAGDASGVGGRERCSACGAALERGREQGGVGKQGDEVQEPATEAGRVVEDGPAVGDVEQGLGCCEGSGAAAAAAGEIASAGGADGECSGRAKRRSGEGSCPVCGARRHRYRRTDKGRGLRGTAWALRYITPEQDWDPEQCQPGGSSEAAGYDKSVLGRAVSRLSSALGAAGAGGGGGGPGQRPVWPDDRRADLPEGMSAAAAAGGSSGRWRPAGGSPRGWIDRESGGPAGGSPLAQRCSWGFGAGGSSVAGGSPPPEWRTGAGGGGSGVIGGSPTQGWSWQGAGGWGAGGGGGAGGLTSASSAPMGLLDEVAAALRTQRTGQRGGGQVVRDGGAGAAAAWRGAMARAASSATPREVEQQQQQRQR